MQWNKEVQVDEWVREKLKSMGLKLGKDFLEKDASAYLKDALKGASKTKKQTGTGIPDFVIEKYKVDNEIIPVIFECKLGVGKLEKYAKDNEKALDFSNDAISKYALNGALHYARVALQNESQKQDHYKEIIAIGIAGDNSQNVRVKIACVFADSSLAYKEIKHTNLDFLENAKSFTHFYKEECKLTEEDRHLILIRGKWHLSYHSAQLNKLMHNHNITAPQRVLYIAGMILSMQSVMSNEYRILTKGLSPADLQGSQENGLRDGELVFERIEEFLQVKVPDSAKRKLMLDSFNEIRKDTDRDKIPKNFTYKEGEKKNPNHKIIAHILKEPSSINKQIFAYIYAHIYKEIDGLNGHLDIMGECYSEFLKYALGDGKELGIVLTPPYVTKMMTQILDITSTDRVMDLATGSAGFLISSMEQMIEDVYKNTAKHSTQANKAILELKTKQLLGIEYNAEMFALATSNMILRGDGSSKIYKANTFETEDSLYVSFAPTRILLNPPFTWDYNGLPFIEFGLDRMRPHGLGAIIIQDSAGNGQAIPITQSILKKHTLKASIKMPIDLFQPMAGVQTSIYIFEAKIPHDFEKPVKFIDFRNDGYKRTKRSLQEVDKPAQRYKDILKIYKQGLNAKLDNSVYEKPINLSEVYVEDFISESGADWNFDQHKKIDTTPTLQDFKKCVSEYLAWEVSNVLKNQNSTQGGLEGNALSPRLRELEKDFKQNGGLWREFKITQLFDYERGTRLTKGHRIAGNIPLLTAGEFNQGVKEFISNEEQKIFSNAITIDMFCNSFVHIKPFCCDDNILVLTAKKQMNQYHLRFISTIIGKDKPKYGYGKQYRIGSLEKHYISLPVLPTACHTDLERSEREVSQNIESKKDFSPTAQNDKNTKSNFKAQTKLTTQGYQIAFDYMESYIKALEAERLQELEAERLQELEAYLKVTGLNDYTLSQKEQEALKAFENLSTPKRERERERVSGTPNEVPLKWESFKIGELFEIKPTKAYKMTNTTLFETKGDVPVVTNSSLNNGVSAYVGLEPTEKGNMITYSDTTTSEGIFYQPRDFVGYSHIQGLYPLVHKDKWNRYSLLYFVSVFRKASFGKFDYGNKFNRKIAKEMRVLLPVLPTACHTEPLGEVSQVESKRDFSLATQTQNDKNVESSATQDYQIAFDFIESFIKAIQKECIKSVVLWQKREAEAYRACVKED
ncbi:SAM-dependent DNA methyltransferase [Campylobacter upsaliensis]|nr:SAM-dependent DNA methyltransferase [Campylobacter upsaliensis]